MTHRDRFQQQNLRCSCEQTHHSTPFLCCPRQPDPQEVSFQTRWSHASKKTGHFSSWLQVNTLGHGFDKGRKEYAHSGTQKTHTLGGNGTKPSHPVSGVGAISRWGVVLEGWQSQNWLRSLRRLATPSQRCSCLTADLGPDLSAQDKSNEKLSLTLMYRDII